LYRSKVDQVGADGFAGFERSMPFPRPSTSTGASTCRRSTTCGQGIHLRGYAQKNPKQEYKREAFEIFGLMQQRIRSDVTRILMTVRIQSAEQAEQVEETMQPQYTKVAYTHADFDPSVADAADSDPESIALAVQNAPRSVEPAAQQPLRRFGQKIGRNDPCPCGSGKKYKQCHGRLA